MAKHPSPRADQLRAMREAKFGRSSLSVSNDNKPDDDQRISRKEPARKKKSAKKA